MKTFKIKNKIPKLENTLYFAVIGEIAAGKSTIYNTLFGRKEPVGVDDTTQEVAHVHSEDNRVYWDSPGLSQHLSITNV